MRNILTIASRELRSSFVTPLAYVVMAGFLLLAGFFFFTLLQQFNAVLLQAAMMPDLKPSLNEWVITPFYQTLEIVLIFLLPVMTMRSLAEEKSSGTYELLATSPISTVELVFGKFLGISTVVAIMLALSFVFPGSLIVVADPEAAPILVGFLGLLLFAWAFTALGVAVSSFTRSQAVAGIVGLVLFLLFFVIDAPAAKAGEKIAEVLRYAAPSAQCDLFMKGVINSSALIYFLSLMALGLFVSVRVLEAQRWR
ncbi:MAG: ABC transporter permease subunit [Bdellovibrionales bacterium]|nr:ABC transporter permease subunit [Bdellovibrionales bacterium]